MERMTKGEGMTTEEYIAMVEKEVESRKEYQQRSQSADGEQIERLLGEKYKLEKENKKLKENGLLGQATMEKVYNKITELETENKNLRAYADNLDSENDNQAIEIEELKKENKKLKDEFMLRLAEAYLLPPTSNQMAEYKQWNYSKWYDEIKNQMRKEIKEED